MQNFSARILNADEFNREDLLEIFANNKSLVPNPLSSSIQVVEDDNGKIIALAVLQPQYHLEPIYVDPNYRNTMLHKVIVDSAINIVKHIPGLRLFVFSPNDKITELAKRFGFKFKDYVVLVREF